MKYNRVLLKLSGEALSGKDNILDAEFLKRTGEQVKNVWIAVFRWLWYAAREISGAAADSTETPRKLHFLPIQDINTKTRKENKPPKAEKYSDVAEPNKSPIKRMRTKDTIAASKGENRQNTTSTAMLASPKRKPGSGIQAARGKSTSR